MTIARLPRLNMLWKNVVELAAFERCRVSGCLSLTIAGCRICVGSHLRQDKSST